jgi:hypothetical protein
MASYIYFLIIPALLSIWKLVAGLKKSDNPEEKIILKNSSFVGIIFNSLLIVNCALVAYFIHKFGLELQLSALIIIGALLILLVLLVSHVLDKFSIEINHKHIVRKMAFAKEKKLYWKDIVSVKYNSTLKAIEIKGNGERIMISEFYTGYQDLIVFLANKGLYM